jgi:hypothetical protein
VDIATANKKLQSFWIIKKFVKGKMRAEIIYKNINSTIRIFVV